MSRFIDAAATEARATPPPAPLKFNCQRLFLTYAQVGDATLEQLLDWLEASDVKFKYAEACEEEHAEGGRHFHAIVVYRGRWESLQLLVFLGFLLNIVATPTRYQRGIRSLDFDGHNCNFDVVKSAKDEYQFRHYLRKGIRTRKEAEHTPAQHEKGKDCAYDDGRPLILEERGDCPPYTHAVERKSGGGSASRDADREVWAHAGEADSQSEFLRRVKEGDPKTYFTRYFDIVNTAAAIFCRSEQSPPDFRRDQFTVPRECDQWVEEVFRVVGVCLAPVHTDTLFFL